MKELVLVTGGAGFIGSHLCDALLAQGRRVRVLDSLIPQVHGEDRERPDSLDLDVDLQVGDVRDPEAVRKALRDVEAVFHFAACVGVGQSLYAMADYTSVNTLGTAVLLEALMTQPLKRLIVASSMSIYGEGLCRDLQGNLIQPRARSLEQLQAGLWELIDEDGRVLTPVPTPEGKTPGLASISALTKYSQERMCLLFGQAYHIPVVALRFFNVYGTRQALSNPYTGVLAGFVSRLLNNHPPLLYEDGGQQRDFVSVHDVVRASLLALDVPEAQGQVFNVASGRALTIRELARRAAVILGREHLQPDITGKYRVGDIRHCLADITLARDVLGYKPLVSMEEGLEELSDWLEGQVPADQAEKAGQELAQRGLTV
jgi:dTDP-L-rhamnose 4-epimerase